MKYNYKTINIYIDEKNNVIIIPTGISKKMKANMNIDVVYELSYPYDPKTLNEQINIALEKCFSKIPDENEKIGVIEKHRGVKSYSKATEGLKLVLFNWDDGVGYSFLPTERKRGYNFLTKKTIKLGEEYTPEELFGAFNKALESCII